jgi:predicted Zn-dependent protease
LGVDLAKLELAQGNAAEAVTALEQVRGNKDFPTATFLLVGKAYAAAGRKEDADKALADFLRVIQPSRSEYQELAAVYERLGEADKAAAMRKGAEGLAPSKTE